MFYSEKENKYIQEGTQFELGSIQYPAQWLNQATAEQKAEIGLQEVIATNSPKSDQYYWVSEELNGAELTYVNTPKDLDTVKANCVSQVNTTAYSILLPSDWMVVKAMETSTQVPAEWNTWRASIRATAADAVTAIGNATDVDGVADVMSNIVWANDPNYVEVAE